MTLLLALLADAHAWTEARLAPVALPETPLAVVPLPRGDATAIVVLGPEHATVVDPFDGHVVDSLPIGGRGAVAVDLDGDGRRELVTCGAHGIRATGWEGALSQPTTLSSDACEAIALQGGDGVTIASVTDGVLRLWTPDGAGGLVDRGPYGVKLGGSPLLATDGDLLAAAGAGGAEITERSAYGRSSLATGGPIGALAAGPKGWAWTLPDRGLVVDVTHRAVPVEEGARLLASGRLDKDDVADLVVVHEGGRIGLLTGSGGAEQVVDAPLDVSGLAVADLDGDRCDEVVLVGSTPPEIAVVDSSLCAPASRVAAAAPGTIAGVPTTRLPPPSSAPALGVPAFLGAGARERGYPASHLWFGAGWVVGGGLGPTFVPIPTFPALAAGMDWGGPTARFFLDIDSAGLFLWMYDDGDRNVGGVHFAFASTGFAFGAENLAIGPYATFGLLGAGAGVRSTWTPFGDDGNRSGLEARLTWFYPQTGEVMLLYVWRGTAGSSSHASSRSSWRAARAAPSGVQVVDIRDDETTVTSSGATSDGTTSDGISSTSFETTSEGTSPSTPADGSKASHRGFLACRQFGGGLGAAVGATSTRFSWEYVGNSHEYVPTGSFALAGWCETGSPRFGAVMGLETAPMFDYVVPGGSDAVHHLASYSMGLEVGGKALRAGPIAQVGFWTVGVGGRVALTPFAPTEGGMRQGLDLRVVALPFGPSVEGMLMYGFWMDPWKK